MSVISGTIGAIGGMVGQAKATSAQKSADATNYMMQVQALNEQKKVQQEQENRFKPYLEAGYKGLGQAQGFDLMQGVGDQPNWDTEYTNKLGAYEESPAYQAQNMLGQQDLARARSARGLDFGAPAAGANASAELSQRLRSTDYDKYRSDLGNRYKALQGEYANRRDVNASKYGQLTDLMKAGQGAANSIGQAGSQYGQQAGQAFGNMKFSGDSPAANYYAGLGGAASAGAGNAIKGLGMAKDAGWFGSGSGAAVTDGMNGITSGTGAGTDMFAGNLWA